MAGYNRVVLVGNLTRDPEYKQLASGQGVCRLGLATNRQFKNRQSGDMVQEVCFIDIDVWGAQAESCNQYLQKGRSVLIEGRLKFDTWEDQNGQSRNKHSIVADRVVFLSSAEQAAEEASEAPVMRPAAKSASQKSAPAPQVEDDYKSADPELERELMDQIAQIKKKNTAPKAAPKKESASEIDFKDQPPFEDELPF